MMNKFNEIIQAACLLMAASRITTTLEIKRYLRAKYPSEQWTQAEISKAMDNALKGAIPNLKYEILDDDNFRTYFTTASIYPTDNSSKKATTGKKKKVVVESPPKAISKSEMADLIKNSKGNFMRITFVKKTNGKVRIMNCNHKTGAVTSLGHINVKERGKDIKQIDPHTLRGLRLNGKTYIVK